MDYKEKYEMALEGIQEILGSGEDSIKMSRLQLRLQGIFPELAKSEDERIREKVITTIHLYYGEPLEDEAKEMIAWLEKQGNNMGISEATKQKLEDNLNKALEKETPESWNKFLDEQKSADTEKGANGNERENPNSAWSEEDEKMYTATIFTLAAFMGSEDKIDWLKSLKGRYAWRPSEEQMKALQTAIGIVGELAPTASLLKEIREQLKKLKE